MAQITRESLKRLEKSRNSVHKTVDATYSTFYSQGGKFIQIDTYGSNNREFKGSISQSVQINEETARYLLEVFKKEFNF